MRLLLKKAQNELWLWAFWGMRRRCWSRNKNCQLVSDVWRPARCASVSDRSWSAQKKNARDDSEVGKDGIPVPPSLFVQGSMHALDVLNPAQLPPHLLVDDTRRIKQDCRNPCSKLLSLSSASMSKTMLLKKIWKTITGFKWLVGALFVIQCLCVIKVNY